MWVVGQINKVLKKIESVFVVVSGFSLGLIICIQVVGRYVLKLATPWAEEGARYIFIWMVFVGSGYAMATKEHINIDIMEKIFAKTKNKDKAKKIMLVISTCAGILFLLVFSSIYMQYLQRISNHVQYSPALKLNMFIPMSAIIVGNVLMFFHSCYLLLDLFISGNRSKEDAANVGSE